MHTRWLQSTYLFITRFAEWFFTETIIPHYTSTPKFCRFQNTGVPQAQRPWGRLPDSKQEGRHATSSLETVL